MTTLLKARTFAIAAHTAVGQRRKYSGEPYWKHPEAVAQIVETVTHTTEMVAAAWLHDVVEDTQVTQEVIVDQFGWAIGDLVYWLTDVSKPEDGNRRWRKDIDAAHIAKAPADAKTIKLADIIHNTESIFKHDEHFAIVYKREILRKMDGLAEGDPGLFAQAMKQLEAGK